MVFSLADLLNQWQSYGIFDLLLPFLLIFALVFGILSSTGILGGQRGINVIIALVIAAMSLQLGFVQRFSQEIFPRLGVGLMVILALLILVGLFIAKDEVRYWYWGLAAIGVIVFLVVAAKSGDAFGWGFGSYGTQELIGWVILAVGVIGVIIAVASGGAKNPLPNRGETTRAYHGRE